MLFRARCASNRAVKISFVLPVIVKAARRTGEVLAGTVEESFPCSLADADTRPFFELEAGLALGKALALLDDLL